MYKHGLYKIFCTKRAVLFVRVCAGCAVLFVRGECFVQVVRCCLYGSLYRSCGAFCTRVRFCAGCAVLFVRQLWLCVAEDRCVCGLASSAAGELVQSSLRVCGQLLPVTGFVQSVSSGLYAQQLIFPGASRCERTESLLIGWLCTHVWIALMPQSQKRGSVQNLQVRWCALCRDCS